MALLLALLCSQAQERRIYNAVRLNGEAPVIDGKFDDPAWAAAERAGGFIQREPYEGAEPTAETEFMIVYDDNNLYMAIRAWEDDPSEIVSRMARRDQIEGDILAVQIDSYADRRTAFTFGVNAAGVKIDFFVSGNGSSEDLTWDPVWFVKTNIDDKGWTAEMQIPFSQLRFSGNGSRDWGLQVVRFIYRKEEMSAWQFIPKEASGWVHLFGDLSGITGIQPRKQFDISPYSVAKTEFYEKIPGNPYYPGNSNNLNAGVDAKVGLTNDLTLDLTINPDFGQVEADPSVVNLTAFETFYEEKRPFFIEGRNIFNFNLTPGDGDMSAENLFYSRRIGRVPQYRPGTGQDEYIKMPGNTPILGAFKLSGKTLDGFSVGAMQTVTAEHRAKISYLGEESLQVVEPLTSYSVARLQKDFDGGNTVLGGMVTSTLRNLSDPSLNFLHKSAFSGGFDFAHYWNERTWYLSAKLLLSHVTGEPEALIRTQLSPAHYFQRPDASHLTLDPSLTSLTGHGGTIEAGKIGGGNFNYGAIIHWKSPGLELNDIGFVRSADEILQVLWAGYRIWEPFSVFRRVNLSINQFYGLDFGHRVIGRGGNINGHTQFSNYWTFSTGTSIQLERYANHFLRGGPSLLIPGAANSWVRVETDSRKRLRFSGRILDTRSFEGGTRSRQYSLMATFLPVEAMNISVGPGYTENRNNLQYVFRVGEDDRERFILARLEQKTLSAAVRLNYSITPELSVQYYGQPFISSGRYDEFKFITDPSAEKYNDRFSIFSGAGVFFDESAGRYYFDENSDGSFDYSIGNPNFNALYFNSNLVMRWEYLPGSVLYLVWSQGRSEFASNGHFSFTSHAGDLFDVKPHNIFLLKISYRIGR